MKILFDNGTPRGLAQLLTGHTVEEARMHGWEQLGNGELIEAAEQAGFEVLVTTDKNIRYQQNLKARKIALVVLQHSQWPMVKTCRRKHPCSSQRRNIGRLHRGRSAIQGIATRREPIAIADLILTEVLQGFDDDRDSASARELLTSLPITQIAGPDIALAAAESFRKLRKAGVTVRKTIDTLIATRCIESGYALPHSDRDFDALEKRAALRVLELGLPAVRHKISSMAHNVVGRPARSINSGLS